MKRDKLSKVSLIISKEKIYNENTKGRGNAAEKRSGENLRFSPGNWAHAQFIMNGMPPSGGGKGGAEKTCGFLPGIQSCLRQQKARKKWKK